MPESSSPFSPSIVFFGTPEFAAISLQEMIDSDLVPQAVVTMPDKPAGRGQKIRQSPVAIAAIKNNLPLLQSFHSNSEKNTDEKKQLNPHLKELLTNTDLAVVVAYGHLIPKLALTLPKYGFLNLHASLLPRWRGAAPIQHAIIAGDKETGVCIMQMQQGLDTGPVLSRSSCPISSSDTGGTLHDRLASMGAKLLVETIKNLPQCKPQKQDEKYANYANKIHKKHGEIDWHNPCTAIDRQIRALHPSPIAWTQIAQQRIRIWQADIVKLETPEKITPGTIIAINEKGIEVVTGSGIIRLTEVQLAGGNRAKAAQLIHGRSQLHIGSVFVSPKH